MNSPAAATTAGIVLGRQRHGAVFFGGIPYAAAPTGARRFRPPQPVEPWTVARDATRPGCAAPQLTGTGLTNSQPVVWDEDCLTLNVVTPDVDDQRRPVLVWIHGGNYRNGQGAIPWYDGTGFARNGIVTVTINYRLGALGFADLGSLDPTFAEAGVAGTLDQIAALVWVRDNIGAFGGDPDRVTVAGQSAGAFSVANLVTSPLAATLFRAAILQSGAGHHVHGRDGSALVAETLLREAGAAGPDDLVGLAPGLILDAQRRVEQALGEPWARRGDVRLPCGAFYPTTVSPVVPERPLDAAARGSGAGVPVLTGTTLEESTLFGMGLIDDESRLRTMVGREVRDGDALCDAYREACPDAPVSELAVAISSDYSFRIPAIRWAEARHEAGAAPTWMYQFSWRSPAFGGALGATHSLEIPFVFDVLGAPGVDIFTGGAAPRSLADEIHRVWVSFVHERALGWEPYTPAERTVRDFAGPTTILSDPRSQERMAWAGLR